MKIVRRESGTAAKWLSEDKLRTGLQALRYRTLGTEIDKGLLFKATVYIILINVAFIYIKPILYMMTTMVKDAKNILDPSVIWVPRSIFLGHLKEASEMLSYGSSFLISLSLASSVAVLQVFSCAVAGYAFARLDFPLKKLWEALLLFTFIMPPQVTILPSIMLFKEFGWLNTFLPMVVPALFGHGLKGAMFVIIYRAFYSTLPKELDEAARIDGAGPFRMFFRVMFPISRSATVVVMLFSFVWNWNDFYFPSLFMFTAENVPLSITLARMAGEMAVAEGAGEITVYAEAIKMAASFLIIMPLLVVYLFAQRWFIEGVERTGLVE
ncbi:carbohydrate ABC transporter permease [Paenibacillus sp. YK5]|uniref:ABC transporter permease n=1 Tax=Paenibacillus naphthalenovorans TaxID=162209 RepID=A0A0U2VJ21_9BACL|nr:MULTISPECIES: carbohydrate ABC transporter permease [Paenibacillus]ALS23379.1 ABC transporter permease [Paenibacillus naphthalenovorans]SDI07106.1 multiple sugar transport system permease protein [Paenibacillus naphthalenovorans]